MTVLKIVDFNVSTSYSQRELLTATGYEEWQSPEMLQRQHYNEKNDMWSAGCILYFMLVGDNPFKSTNVAKR